MLINKLVTQMIIPQEWKWSDRQNQIAKEKKERRPDDQSFLAVQMKDKFDVQDKFMIYSLDDGSQSDLPHVLKCSKEKAETLINLNVDGNHRLNSSSVFLDVLHSHCKGWKTYTLTFFDGIL